MRRVLRAGYGLGRLLVGMAWVLGVVWLLRQLDWTGVGTPPERIFESTGALIFGGLGWLLALLFLPLGVLYLLFGPLIWLFPTPPPPPPLPLRVPSAPLPAWDLHACTWVYQTGYTTIAGTWLVWERCTYCQQWRSRKT